MTVYVVGAEMLDAMRQARQSKVTDAHVEVLECGAGGGELRCAVLVATPATV